ncbi:hypothetical protein SAMN02910400_00447 [Lachnospiraceae bacterium C10]|nr:hypothetical protein SAMN02910400_00447 [Lachnospiraceae bacterium C10]
MTSEDKTYTTAFTGLPLAREQAFERMLYDDFMIYKTYTKDKGPLPDLTQWQSIGETIKDTNMLITSIERDHKSTERISDEKTQLLLQQFPVIAKAGSAYLLIRKHHHLLTERSDRAQQRIEFAHFVHALPQRASLIDYATEKLHPDKASFGLSAELFLIHLAKSDMIRDYFVPHGQITTAPKEVAMFEKDELILKAVASNVLATYLATEMIDEQKLDRRCTDFYRHAITGTVAFKDICIRRIDHRHFKESLLPEHRLTIKHDFITSIAQAAKEQRLGGSTSRAKAQEYIGRLAIQRCQ